MTADVKVETVKGYNTVFLITVGSAARLADWASGDTAVAKVVPNLGEAAYAGPDGVTDDATVVAFRKGPRAIRIISSLSPTDSRHVSEAKLVELARLMDSRIP
jgi:hypothetical protein